jgi:hypothetical protein
VTWKNYYHCYSYEEIKGMHANTLVVVGYFLELAIVVNDAIFLLKFHMRYKLDLDLSFWSLV